jgi:hypothetical protein
MRSTRSGDRSIWKTVSGNTHRDPTVLLIFVKVICIIAWVFDPLACGKYELEDVMRIQLLVVGYCVASIICT